MGIIKMEDPVTLYVKLKKDEAASLSEFIKRIGYEDIRKLCNSKSEAYEVEAALNSIKLELAFEGYNPR